MEQPQQPDTSVSTEPQEVRTALSFVGGHYFAINSELSTESTPPPKKPTNGKRRSQNHLNINPGVQNMKTYPLTEDQIENLFGIGLLATICFSLASGLFSFALGVHQNLAFTQELPLDVETFWETLETVAWLLSGVLSIIGLLFVRRGSTRLAKIKEETTFKE